MLQGAGWAGYAIATYIGSFLHDMRPVWLFVILANAMMGCWLSIPLRYINRWARQQQPLAMVISVVGSAYLISLIWAVTKNFNYWQMYKYGYQPDEWLMYTANTINAFVVMLAWCGLYFGFKNYQMLQREKQTALKASTMAHQAHLKMLRYQLNPHFLFNTLNALSTLILMKDNDTAEKMVNKLSDFLRYSLDKDPIKKVPLKQEVLALKLYLEIEKVRFEDRLNVHWDIADDSEDALVPSLILQPLIENAIKYAIARKQEGGIIWITSHLFGRDLLLEVKDNGPGADIQQGKLTRNNGVGLPNIQERLHSLYGENCSFLLEHNQPSGVKVRIRLPFEVQQDGA